MSREPMAEQELALPLVAELPSGVEAEDAFRRLVDLPHVLYFDSARRGSPLGRYSFITADPFEFHIWQPGDCDGLGRLAAITSNWQTATVAELPPFQGGAAGLASYDLGRQLERIPAPRLDEFQVPALAVGLYDVVLAFDHQQQRSWIISQGFPEREPAARRRRAEQRLAEFRQWLERPARDGLAETAPRQRVLSADQLAPMYPTGRLPELASNFSQPDYLAAVARVVEYIHAGDIFQVNLAQRLLHPAVDDPVALYLRLRRRNAATFAGFFDLGEFQLASASPERFLQVRAGEVEARPIKGTRQRTTLPEADLFSGDELQQSTKDRAENIMIVDLLRNDLSRVCTPESVRVVDLCRLETYEFVQHLVSSIRGTLAPGRGPLDLLQAAFPGGSITGAPKVRAMEIIAELEPTARGAYCGSLFYLGFDGALDSSILIRTITAGRGWWQAPVGGGIVAASQPAAEYQETWHKAEGMLRAMVR